MQHNTISLPLRLKEQGLNAMDHCIAPPFFLNPVLISLVNSEFVWNNNPMLLARPALVINVLSLDDIILILANRRPIGNKPFSSSISLVEYADIVLLDPIPALSVTVFQNNLEIPLYP